MEEITLNILIIIILILFIIIVVGAIHGFSLGPIEGLKKTANSIYTAIKNVFNIMRPKTPIQKEIAAEKKEIEQLEKQKADMAELERLKERREKLFEEVRGRDEGYAWSPDIMAEDEARNMAAEQSIVKSSDDAYHELKCQFCGGSDLTYSRETMYDNWYCHGCKVRIIKDGRIIEL